MIDRINHMGVEVVEMKIVGLLQDEEEIYEMEYVAKIFLVEERMQHLPYKKKTNPHIPKLLFTSSKNLPTNRNHILNMPMFTIKGFN